MLRVANGREADFGLAPWLCCAPREPELQFQLRASLPVASPRAVALACLPDCDFREATDVSTVGYCRERELTVDVPPVLGHLVLASPEVKAGLFLAPEPWPLCSSVDAVVVRGRW